VRGRAEDRRIRSELGRGRVVGIDLHAVLRPDTIGDDLRQVGAPIEQREQADVHDGLIHRHGELVAVRVDRERCIAEVDPRRPDHPGEAVLELPRRRTALPRDDRLDAPGPQQQVAHEEEGGQRHDHREREPSDPTT
jgi:hypothetical protein